MKAKILLALSLLATSIAHAEVKMESLFSNNMILQQNTSAAIWGTSTSKKTTLSIVGSWNNQIVKAKIDKDGSWRVALPTPSWGGPYTITINDGDETVIENVLIGEVWIASGQSNMEMEMAGFNSQPIENSNRDIARSYDPMLRVMDVERTVSDQALTTVNSQGWSEAHSSVVAPLSASAYYFARTLRESLDIPIGILVSAWGGTSINSWVTPEYANSYEDVIAREKKSSPRSQHYPGGLHNGMINPIAGYTARGFIWYQGESDRFRPETYAQKMLDMVTTWREMWGNNDMPFYFAQIAPFEYTVNGAHDTSSPYMREAMEAAVDVVPNSAMICLSDAGLQGCIHPSNKAIVGERFAYLALNRDYGQKSIIADYPKYKSFEVDGDKLIITFDNAEIGLTSYSQEITDFEIAGEDGVFVPAIAKIRGNTVILTAEGVSSPTKAQYGFKNWFKGNIYNVAGLPASSFRTEK
ncbi:MAG: sialate O-acetylesterase [Rikenellaceae bacterium]